MIHGEANFGQRVAPCLFDPSGDRRVATPAGLRERHSELRGTGPILGDLVVRNVRRTVLIQS